MTSTETPDVTIEPCRSRVRARFANHIIADTDDALILREEGAAPVLYFPVEDVEMGYLGGSDPEAMPAEPGQAHWFSVLIDGEFAEKAAWTYRAPEEGMAVLADRIAFDPARIEVYEIDDAAIDAGLGHAAARPV
jgi:uncharacterized protein (DUF427 family)